MGDFTDDDRVGWSCSTFRQQVEFAKFGLLEFQAARSKWAIALKESRWDEESVYFLRRAFFRSAMLTALHRCSRLLAVLSKNGLLPHPASDKLIEGLSVISELRNADEHVEDAIVNEPRDNRDRRRIERNTKMETFEIGQGGNVASARADKTSDVNDIIGGLIRLAEISWIVGELDTIASNAEQIRLSLRPSIM